MYKNKKYLNDGGYDAFKSTDTTVWGPHYWYVIHSYAENYPVNPTPLDIEVATNFIKSIPFILPCRECSKHAYEYIKKKYYFMGEITSTKSALVRFFCYFHDHVNNRLGKSLFLS